MAEWNILLTDGLEDNGQALLRHAARVDDRDGIREDELLQIAENYDAMIIRGRTKVNAEVMTAARRLKVVGRSGVGVDNIDLEAAKAHQVLVVNTPTATSVAVAELAVGLMLALARAIPKGDAGMKKGEWLKKQLLGNELNGKTLGVIGMGHIGSAVATRASAFNMEVLGYDPFLPPDVIGSRSAQPVSLDELLASADFITLHIPLNEETHNIISGEKIQKMKLGARIISTARGGLIDEQALLDALNSGHIAGAGLDVFAQEPPGTTDLVTHPNVIAVPHIGAQTVEAQERAAVEISHEVLAALRGEPLRWRVS
jgi:D-3-phosphoglycerate dehydrogenase